MKVKVRIAVAVAPSGKWNSFGYRENEAIEVDEYLMENAVEGIDEPGEAHYFIEAELEIPETKTIKAEVKP